MEIVGAVVVFGIFGGTALVTWLISEQRIRRRLRKAMRVPIAAVQEGQVARVVGRVCRGKTVEAPMTGRRCFYYEAVVEEMRKHTWKKVIRETGGVPFVVEDDSGRAVVDPAHADVVLVFDEDTGSGSFDDATRDQEAFLARHKQKSKGSFFNRSLRYREAIIEHGEQVAVMGQGVREPDPDAKGEERDYRGELPTRLHMRGGKKSPLLISDDPDLTR